MRFAHASYRVTDRDRSVGFYRLLGFEPLEELPIGDALHLFLGLGGRTVLELVVDPDRPVGEAGGYRHVALETGRMDEVLARVPAERGPFRAASGVRLAFLRDPDGYEIELIESGAQSVDDLTLATAFLYREAELLDDNLVDDWFATLDEDLEYLVPLRYSRERANGAGFSPTAYHMKDTHTSMAGRVKRLSGEYAWAEDPPSRTRRLVTNIRVRREDELLHVRSNLMLYRSRGDSPEHQLLVGERHDVLRVHPGGEVRLARRTVLLDQTTLATHNLAVFL
ncbi:3-phenylpropionate/cinnamic acid dioxygenase subunit beta [Streptosporangium sp. NPDC051022]|uniref:3-phenylpropionate/cinnamic acid dioxygenase subunit beta n=1 Tax=Streptosporangium sp. NPDC051022 TaxID=3155752 RepID=UPI0034200039